MFQWILGGGVRAGEKPSFVEPLEARRMLAVDLGTECGPDEFCIMSSTAASLPATVGPNLVGKYKGKVTVEGRTKAINSKIHIITHVGNRVTGTFSVQNLGIVQFAVTGKSKKNGSFTAKGEVAALGLSGSLAGKRAKDGSLSGTWEVTYGANTYKGTFAYSKTS